MKLVSIVMFKPLSLELLNIIFLIFSNSGPDKTTETIVSVQTDIDCFHQIHFLG